MPTILAHVAAIVALWLVFSFALFLGLQVEPPFGNIWIGATIVLAAAYVHYEWLR